MGVGVALNTGSGVSEASERTGFLWRCTSLCGAIILVFRLLKTPFSTEFSLFWVVTLIFDPRTMTSVPAWSRCLSNFGLFQVEGWGPLMELCHIYGTGSLNEPKGGNILLAGGQDDLHVLGLGGLGWRSTPQQRS